MRSVRTFVIAAILGGAACSCLGAIWLIRHALSDRSSPIVVVDSFAPHNSSPIAPEQIATDPELQAWTMAFRGRRAGGDKPTPADAAALDELIHKTPLGCRDLTAIALSIRRNCTDDRILGILFTAVIRKGDQELRRFPPGAIEAVPILVEMNRTKSTLWKLPDNPDHTYINTLSLLFNDSIRWIAPDNAELQLDLYQAYSERAECLMLCGKLDEALAANEAIPESQIITDSEKGSAALGRSLILIQMGRNAEAAKYLRIAASVGDRQQTAQRILVDVLCKMGRGTDAKTEYVEFIRRFHPQLAQAQEYRGKVIVALADESGNPKP